MIEDEHGCTYEPWQKDGRIGYKVTKKGRTEFIYFNPSTSDSEGQSNVFIYQGPHGDPDRDQTCCFLKVCDA